MEKLESLDVNMYIISNDQPEQQLELYNAIEEKFGFSVPFISDPDLEIAKLFNMDNGEVAYRGYGLLDSEGKVIFKTVNDHWGEEFDKTETEIKEEYNNLTN